MKKNFLVFFMISFLPFLMLLNSCKEEYDENEIRCDDLITDLLYGYNENRIYESCTDEHTFSWLYSCSKARNTSMISGITSSESQIICGYLSEETVKTLDNISGGIVKNCRSCLSGIINVNQYLCKYHYLVNSGELNETKNYIHLYSFKDEKIPMEYNQKKLIFVYSVFPFYLANGETYYVYGNMHGEVNEEYYEITPYNHLENVKNQEFIILSSSINKYMFFEHFLENTIKIKNNSDTKSLYDDGFSIRNCFATYKDISYYEFAMRLQEYRKNYIDVEPFFDASEFFYFEDEISTYFEKLKPAILSEEKKLISEEVYYYDYFKIKEIFNIK